MIIDSHCHLDFPDFAEELDAVLARSAEAGVGLMVTISTKLSTFDKVRAIAEAHENVYCSVGVHPHEADKEGVDNPGVLIDLAQHPKVVGIGESGLDYYYEHSAREAQATSFRAHIAAARETGLPLIVHTRDADEDTAAILREEWERGPFPCLLHCFSAGAPLAREAVAMGMYVSFSGILTFPKAQNLRDIAAELPGERLLVETDSPYLAPVPKRGKRNEPAYVVHTAQCLAEARNETQEETARQTSENFFRLFTKVPPRNG